MKNILFALLILASPQLAMGQSQDALTVKAKKISSSETPIEVIAAVKEDFPNYTVTDYYVFPAKEINDVWAVTVDDHLNTNAEIDHYTVQLKGEKGDTYYTLYDKEGIRIKSKVMERNQPLPSAVSKAIVSNPKYKGYSLQSDMHMLNINHRIKKEFWEVNVKKGKTTKKLFYTPDGKFIKEK